MTTGTAKHAIPTRSHRLAALLALCGLLGMATNGAGKVIDDFEFGSFSIQTSGGDWVVDVRCQLYPDSMAP